MAAALFYANAHLRLFCSLETISPEIETTSNASA